MIIHLLRDGQRVTNIVGKLVTINGKTINAYQLLIKGAGKSGH